MPGREFEQKVIRKGKSIMPEETAPDQDKNGQDVPKKVTNYKYVGEGRWFDGIPMRDLTAEEIQKKGLDLHLIHTSGLWQPIEE
jgi:hypothetical protein